MAKGLSGGKAGNGGMKGGGSLFPQKGYTVLSSSSSKVNNQKGNLKIGKSMPK